MVRDPMCAIQSDGHSPRRWAHAEGRVAAILEENAAPDPYSFTSMRLGDPEPHGSRHKNRG